MNHYEMPQHGWILAIQWDVRKDYQQYDSCIYKIRHSLSCWCLTDDPWALEKHPHVPTPWGALREESAIEAFLLRTPAPSCSSGTSQASWGGWPLCPLPLSLLKRSFCRKVVASVFKCHQPQNSLTSQCLFRIPNLSAAAKLCDLP